MAKDSKVKRYEGLFILNLAGKEEGLKEVIDKVTEEIKAAGGDVQNVQKMDKRQFARVADKRYSAGYYVNFIFQIEPEKLSAVSGRFTMNDDVFRVMFTVLPEGTTHQQTEPATA